MENYYQKNIEISSLHIQKLSTVDTFFSVIRLLSFLSILFLVYYVITHQTWMNWLYCVFSIVLFIIILNFSEKFNKRLTYFQSLKKVYEQELNSIIYRKYPNANGLEFQDANHQYVNDLDIFGEQSLFHALNRCRTFSGYYYFANQLKYPLKDKKSIIQRQESVTELIRKKDFIFRTLALFPEKKIGKITSDENIHVWLQQVDHFNLSKLMFLFIHIVPFINLILLIIALAIPVFYTILLFFIIIQGIIINRHEESIKLIKNNLNVIMGDAMDFDLYSNAFSEIDFESTQLQNIKNQVTNYRCSVSELNRMLTSFDISDSFMGVMGKIIFLSHIKTAVKLEKWRRNNHEAFLQIRKNICEWETLVNLSIFAMNHPKFAFPEIMDSFSPDFLIAENLGHPLIPENKRVTNSISIKNNNLFIITGANMAGKSTFLRTVGINLLLAQIGAPVCASRFDHVLLSMFTSMRTVDDLENGISYFYAEALRIKQILSFLESGENVLLIIDELFRGTNSNDRIQSSLSFLSKLTTYLTVSALIATHDLSVTDLEKKYPQIITNYCFECTNQGEKLFFDYFLKKGITQSNNAYWLLRQMQVVD